MSDSGITPTNWFFPGAAYSMFGYLGVTASMALSALGAAYGTAKSGAGLASMGVLHPSAVMRNMIPVVMAGVLGIYGLIISVIIMQNVKNFDSYSHYSAFAQLAAGLATGGSSLGAGYAIGIVGDAGVRAVAQQPGVFIGMILMLIFAEALGLYGLIVGIVLSQNTDTISYDTLS